MVQRYRRNYLLLKSREKNPPPDSGGNMASSILCNLSDKRITARSTGASAKFTGSGGAIVGTYDGKEMFESLRKKLGKLGVQVLKPRILSAD